MKSYRLSHQSERKTKRYEEEIYRRGSYDDLIWQEERKILVHELKKLKERIFRVRYLDFACGTGRIIEYVEKKVDESIGVDIAREMLAIAKERLTHSRLIEADITINDVLRGQTFDLITAFRIFLNAEPPLRDAIFAALAPKLSHDGIFIFNIHGNTWSFRLPMIGWYRLFCGRRLNHLSYWRIKHLLARHGLYIERFYGFGIIPKPFYRFCPRISFFFDRLLARIPFIKYISYNLIFVGKRV